MSDMNLSMALILASATMQKLANRKPPTEEELAKRDAENAERLKKITDAEHEEMLRAPRAYYRRLAKLTQTKGGGE